MKSNRSAFHLITAVTAVTALAAGMMLALSMPAPSGEEFSLFVCQHPVEAA
jgi:hypothetical protein